MVCGVEMDLARGDFEFAMNKCYFDANMLNRTNFNVFRALKVGCFAVVCDVVWDWLCCVLSVVEPTSTCFERSGYWVLGYLEIVG